MYKDNTYPFKQIEFSLFTCLDECLGTNSLLLHYNNLYLNSLNKLNCLLEKYPFLQNYSLDEIIYNINNIKIPDQNELLNLSGSVYNHQVFFSCLSNCTYDFNNYSISKAIINSFSSIPNFYKEFKDLALSLVGSGYIFLVCDRNGELSLFKTSNYDTPIPFNLYPLCCIDMWEHSYYLKFNTDKSRYIDAFLSKLNIPYIEQEYSECLRCIRK